MTTATAEPATGLEPAGDAEEQDALAVTTGTGLFDASVYLDPALRIEQVDEQEIEKIAINIAGRIILDRTNPDDVALYNSLKLGKAANLRVSGRVGGVGAKGATNKDGELDVVVGSKRVLVDTVWAVPAEEL